MNGIFDGFDNTKNHLQRDYCSFVIFGDLGKGKSSWLRQFSLMYYDGTKGKMPRKVLICDPSESRAFDDFRQITLAEIKMGEISGDGKVRKWGSGIRVLRNIDWNDDTWFQILTQYFKNGLLILDESRDFFKPSGISPVQKRLFTVHRNNCVDIMLVSHNFMDLPLNIRKQFRVYITFQTGDKPTNEAWFTSRTLPEALWEHWQLLNRIIAPASRISPYIWYDSVARKAVFYIAPGHETKTWVVIQENPVVKVKLSEFLKRKLKLR